MHTKIYHHSKCAWSIALPLICMHKNIGNQKFNYEGLNTGIVKKVEKASVLGEKVSSKNRVCVLFYTICDYFVSISQELLESEVFNKLLFVLSFVLVTHCYLPIIV